jgi:hypothetical protein
MTYEGKHRLERDGGLGIGKIAGLAGVTAATAAILSVGVGAGTANADGGVLHNLFSPKKPSTSTTSTNLSTTSKSVFGVPGKSSFGQIVVAPPTGDGSYFSFNGTGSAVKGLCLNPKGC